VRIVPGHILEYVADMARPLRIRLPGGIFHVTSRGNRREPIYCSDSDRLVWLDAFGRVCARFGWICYAWCQMSNHYHFVVETSDGDLSSGMQHLNGVFTQYFNRTHGRVGHVFQGRFQAILINGESYLLEVLRYVVLNPVRASIVGVADAWPWSSYRATAGLETAPAWLPADRILAHFGAQRELALASYAAFVRNGVASPSPWENIHGQIYLADKHFLEQLRSQAFSNPASLEVPRIQRLERVPSIDDYRRTSSSRREAMALAYLHGAYTMKAIAEYFDVHYATVSRAVAAYDQRSRQNGALEGAPRTS